uniref:ParE toxin of type II toxin-antitoxin system, parDE n=1 Tax=Candidatus Kentrum sp. TC TaxID=2126339 RepID=A0A450YWF7_9GAMM|nr:MAG: ParE toxin of type II toxin-antitoxin system, parDE [Candidatus Kentron sp. TC]
MVIQWSKRARADIRDPKAYIAKDSPYYAKRFTERIIASVEHLETFPKMGRLVPETKTERISGSRSTKLIRITIPT